MENQIKMYREAAGHDQETLAIAIGVSRETVNRYERGKAEPSLAVADVMAHVLGCTVYDLWPSMASAGDYALAVKSACADAKAAMIDAIIAGTC